MDPGQSVHTAPTAVAAPPQLDPPGTRKYTLQDPLSDQCILDFQERSKVGGMGDQEFTLWKKMDSLINAILDVREAERAKISQLPNQKKVPKSPSKSRKQKVLDK